MSVKKINFEKIGDYSIALMEEILGDIKELPRFSSNIVYNKLEIVNNKIDLARKEGVNVNALEKEILDFRITLFKRDVNTKREEINNNGNIISFNLTRIKKQYNELIKEKNIDYDEMKFLMLELYNEVLIAKIKLMINDIKKSEMNSVYTIDKIVDELAIAKKRGLNVEDIENMLFN